MLYNRTNKPVPERFPAGEQNDCKGIFYER